MWSEIRCMNCSNFDRCDRFRSSNLRRCLADGKFHWKGDNAEECGYFIFPEDKNHVW